MIGYLSGTIIDTTDNYTLVDVQGVGYIVYATTATLGLSVPGSNQSLHIHTIVREQNLDLYGFSDLQEKQLFELLITISGIGPKVALGILNVTTPNNLVQAVQTKDSSILTKVSGIGKKNAEKIILELENKIDESWLSDSPASSHDDLEVFEALEALGYKPRSIQEALGSEEIKSLESTQEKIRAIMKQLS